MVVQYLRNTSTERVWGYSTRVMCHYMWPATMNITYDTGHRGLHIFIFFVLSAG